MRIKGDDEEAFWEEPNNSLGIGTITQLTDSEPTPQERARMRRRQPIGFVHFEEKD